MRGSVVNNGKKSYEVHSLKRAVSRLSTSRDFFLGHFCSKFKGSAKSSRLISQFHFSSKRPKEFHPPHVFTAVKSKLHPGGFIKKLVVSVTRLPHIVPAKIAPGWDLSPFLSFYYFADLGQ